MNFKSVKDKIPMSYQEQLLQHDYCDNCFSKFTCENCTHYTFPCLNCELNGHICSLNCEPLPVYHGPKYPPGLPIPPMYEDNFDIVSDKLEIVETDSEFDTDTCDHCLSHDLICYNENDENSCDNCLKYDLICYNENDEKINKVLPKGKTYKQVFDEEQNKNECCECGDENNIVDWIYNDTDNIYELKNACDNCLDCGALCNEDNANE